MDILNFLGIGKKPSPASVAKDRLKLVLIDDRAQTSTHVLEMIKADILKVITNYIEIDEDELDINISSTKSENGVGDLPVLYANIPIKNMRKTRE